MRILIRSLLINVFALWLISQIGQGVIFERGYETLIITAAALGLFNLIVKPLINILLLPINILTLGTLRWLVNVLTLYLMTVFVPGFRLVGFHFSGLAFQGISLPAFDFGTISAYIIVSFLLSLISGILFWIAK